MMIELKRMCPIMRHREEAREILSMKKREFDVQEIVS
jgi:hypothetical protein